MFEKRQRGDRSLTNAPQTRSVGLDAVANPSPEHTATWQLSRGVGLSDLSESLSSPVSSFTQFTVSGVAVTNGSYEIGVSTTSSSGQTVAVDDFMLTRD